MERVSEEVNQRAIDNQKLVHHVAKRFLKTLPSRKLEYDDIFQIGFMGLMKAAERFDEDYGVKFSTYAVPMIKGEILRFLRDYSEGVKFARSSKDIARKINELNWYKKEPEWIAKELQVKVSKIYEAFEYMNNKQCNNIEQTMYSDGDGQDITLGDTLGIDDDFSGMFVNEFIETLSEKDRTIVEGILREKTQTEIGEEIGVSQVQVSRLQKAIGLKLKQYMGVDDEMKKAKGDMKKAKVLLATTNKTPKEIAEITGCQINSIRTYATKYRNVAKDSLDKAVKRIGDEVEEKSKKEAPRDKVKDQASEFVKELQNALSEKDKLIKLKTEDQAQLMKENGDLRKDLELKISDNKLLSGKNATLSQELSKLETDHEWALSTKRAAIDDIEKLEVELSDYKEKLAKADDQIDILKDHLRDANEKLQAQGTKYVVEEPAPTNEVEELIHKIECLEKTLMCYMPNGR